MSSLFWPAKITASQIGPSCNSPSPVNAIRIESRRQLAANAKPCATPKPCPMGPVAIATPGRNGAGMAVQNARVGPRVPQHRPVEGSQLRVDRRQRRHRVVLAEDERVLPEPGGILQVVLDETVLHTRASAIPRAKKAGFPQTQFPLQEQLVSLDSTTISLCLILFPRAEVRRAKGGVKAHALVDHDDYLPAYVLLTGAKPTSNWPIRPKSRNNPARCEPV